MQKSVIKPEDGDFYVYGKNLTDEEYITDFISNSTLMLAGVRATADRWCRCALPVLNSHDNSG